MDPHLAFVNVDLAVSAGEAWNAAAGVVVDAVHAGGAIQARIRITFVNVDLAVNTWGEEKSPLCKVAGKNGKGHVEDASEALTCSPVGGEQHRSAVNHHDNEGRGYKARETIGKRDPTRRGGTVAAAVHGDRVGDVQLLAEVELFHAVEN